MYPESLTCFFTESKKVIVIQFSEYQIITHVNRYSDVLSSIRSTIGANGHIFGQKKFHPNVRERRPTS